MSDGYKTCEHCMEYSIPDCGNTYCTCSSKVAELEAENVKLEAEKEALSYLCQRQTIKITALVDAVRIYLSDDSRAARDNLIAALAQQEIEHE